MNYEINTTKIVVLVLIGACVWLATHPQAVAAIVFWVFGAK